MENKKHKNKKSKNQNWGSGHPLWPPAATTQNKIQKNTKKWRKVPLRSEISSRGSLWCRNF